MDGGPQVSARDRRSESVFVGRKRELFKLCSALDRAKSGYGTVFLISGRSSGRTIDLFT